MIKKEICIFDNMGGPGKHCINKMKQKNTNTVLNHFYIEPRKIKLIESRMAITGVRIWEWEMLFKRYNFQLYYESVLGSNVQHGDYNG